MDNTTFTFGATGRGSDGSKLNFGEVAHITAESITWDEDAHDPIVSGLRSQFSHFRCK